MKPIRIRPGYIPYTLVAAVLLTGGSALVQAEYESAAMACLLMLVPLIAAAALDRIEFDGRRLIHRGPLAFLLSTLFRTRRELTVGEIETIVTESTTFNVATGDSRMTYRTRISGPGVEILVRSHRAAYVPFVKQLFRAAGPRKLDPRSFELFEYLESHATVKGSPILKDEIRAMPVPRLRRIANALKIAGRLSQASSYFRVAYEKEPRNPALLYEMSRFFRTSAHTEDVKLMQRSDACLRLAARLAGSEADLLERIGEAFFERLDYKRATDCFRRALDLDPTRFRANIGLAEIALRDGKLAHVAHYYHAAAANDDAAIARLAQREAEYYERLMSDDDFLDAELRRIRVSNQLRWARRLAGLVFFLAWLSAGVAGRFYSFIEEFGWALMATSGLLWCAASLSMRWFRRRMA
jgi:tetratricopeptide (TPR) repeat protein